jgi:hypothetical protein
VLSTTLRLERDRKVEAICPLAGDWIAGDLAFSGVVEPGG